MQQRPMIRLTRDDIPAIAAWTVGLCAVSLAAMLALDPLLPAHLSYDKSAEFLALAPLCDAGFAALMVGSLKLPVVQTRLHRIEGTLSVVLAAVFFAAVAVGAGDSALPNLVTGDIACVAFAASVLSMLPCVWWEWTADVPERGERRVGMGAIYTLVSLGTIAPAVAAIALVLSHEDQLDWMLRGFVFAGIGLLIVFIAFFQATIAHRRRQRLNGTFVERRNARSATRAPAVPRRVELARFAISLGYFALLVAVAALTLLVLDAGLLGRQLRSPDHQYIVAFVTFPGILFTSQLFPDLAVPRTLRRRLLGLGIAALFCISETAYLIVLAARYDAPNRMLAVSLASSAAAVALCVRVVWREREAQRPILSIIVLVLDLPVLLAGHLIASDVHPNRRDWAEVLVILPAFWLAFCLGTVTMSGRPNAKPLPAPEPVAAPRRPELGG